MAYDYNKLLGRVTEKYGTQGNFAEAMDMSERSMSMKLNNKRGWKQHEISTACNLLDINATDIPVYFFALQVQMR